MYYNVDISSDEVCEKKKAAQSRSKLQNKGHCRFAFMETYPNRKAQITTQNVYCVSTWLISSIINSLTILAVVFFN